MAATGVRGGDGESKVNVTLEELKRVILGGDAITLDTLLSSQVLSIKIICVCKSTISGIHLLIRIHVLA